MEDIKKEKESESELEVVEKEQQKTEEAENGRVPYMKLNPPDFTCDAGVDGIKYDFNLGARISLPKGKYRVVLFDKDADIIIYNAKTNEEHPTIVRSAKLYYLNLRIEVYKEEEKIFSHDYNAEGKNVLIKFPDVALGDTIAWFPYAEEFRKKHNCKVYVAVSDRFKEIFQNGYPNLIFVGLDDIPENLYATYYVGLFSPWDGRELQPVDWRVVGLQQHGAYILGVDPKPIRPNIIPSQVERPIKEKYVCIATQATAQRKYWNNAFGWIEVVEYLRELGYRVLCVDRESFIASEQYGNSIPYGAEDFTGQIPLKERVNLIAHADFFIGLSSGLSWLAWGTGVPVVLISGFTSPNSDFPTPYRVQHFHTCHSCASDQRIGEQYGNFGDCPHHKGTDREFECSRTISSGFVKKTIDRLIEEEREKKKNAVVAFTFNILEKMRNKHALTLFDYIGKWNKLDDEKKTTILNGITKIVRGWNIKKREAKILYLIAETGVYSRKDISEEIEKRELPAEWNNILPNILDRLVSMRFASYAKTEDAGSEGGEQPIILTKSGFWFYVFQNKRNPVKSQYDLKES